MYTRCPNCQTYFKISAEQLKKAGGKVRCGQCSKVFNSLGNLLEELPVALADRGKAKPTPPPLKPAATPPKPAVAPTPAPPVPAPKPRPAPAATSFTAPEAMPAAKPAAMPPKAAPPPKPEPVAPRPEKAISDDAIVFDDGVEKPLVFGDGASDTLDLGGDDKIENVQAGPFSSVKDLVQYQAADGGDTYSGTHNLLWGSGVAVLLLLFIFQYSYYMRDDLARYPELRPWIQSLCEIAQCELPLQQNIDLIKLTHRDITSHPRVKGALLINAIIVNNATFAQPFPAMQITLSDISGSVIAKRRFQPNEYLDADVNLRRGMPPSSPVQIGLEIADPGKDAVNFEFNFFYPNS